MVGYVAFGNLLALEILLIGLRVPIRLILGVLARAGGTSSPLLKMTLSIRARGEVSDGEEEAGAHCVPWQRLPQTRRRITIDLIYIPCASSHSSSLPGSRLRSSDSHCESATRGASPTKSRRAPAQLEAEVGDAQA